MILMENSCSCFFLRLEAEALYRAQLERYSALARSSMLPPPAAAYSPNPMLYNPPASDLMNVTPTAALPTSNTSSASTLSTLLSTTNSTSSITPFTSTTDLSTTQLPHIHSAATGSTSTDKPQQEIVHSEKVASGKRKSIGGDQASPAKKHSWDINSTSSDATTTTSNLLRPPPSLTTPPEVVAPPPAEIKLPTQPLDINAVKNMAYNIAPPFVPPPMTTSAADTLVSSTSMSPISSSSSSTSSMASKSSSQSNSTVSLLRGIRAKGSSERTGTPNTKSISAKKPFVRPFEDDYTNNSEECTPKTEVVVQTEKSNLNNNNLDNGEKLEKEETNGQEVLNINNNIITPNKKVCKVSSSIDNVFIHYYYFT